MKIKIIINIFIGYLILLSIVLIFQVKSKEIVATESISSEVKVEDKMKKSTFLYLNSPFFIINETQNVIDNDLTITPLLIKNDIYIPIKFVSSAYNANINFYKTSKQVILRLNNKAIIFYNNSKKIKIINNTDEVEQELDLSPLFINDRFYIPLEVFASIFEKEVFFCNNLIVISNIKDIFDPTKDAKLIENISNYVKSLPTLQSKFKLDNLLNNVKDVDNLDIKYNLNYNENTVQDKLNEEGYIKTIDKLDIYFNNNALYFKEGKDVLETLDFTEEIVLNNVFIFKDSLAVVYKDMGEHNYFYIRLYNDNGLKTLKVNGKFSKIYFSNNTISIISSLEPTETIIDFNTEKEISLEDIIYFPELNSNKYTVITNIDISNTNIDCLTKVFFGVGENVIYKDDNLYFITKQNKTNFIHSFKILENKDIVYLNRSCLKGKILEINYNSIDSILFKVEENQNEKYYVLEDLLNQKYS